MIYKGIITNQLLQAYKVVDNVTRQTEPSKKSRHEIFASQKIWQRSRDTNKLRTGKFVDVTWSSRGHVHDGVTWSWRGHPPRRCCVIVASPLSTAVLCDRGEATHHEGVTCHPRDNVAKGASEDKRRNKLYVKVSLNLREQNNNASNKRKMNKKRRNILASKFAITLEYAPKTSHL